MQGLCLKDYPQTPEKSAVQHILIRVHFNVICFHKDGKQGHNILWSAMIDPTWKTYSNLCMLQTINRAIIQKPNLCWHVSSTLRYFFSLYKNNYVKKNGSIIILQDYWLNGILRQISAIYLDYPPFLESKDLQHHINNFLILVSFILLRVFCYPLAL